MTAVLRLLAALPTWLFAGPVLVATLLFDLVSWPVSRRRTGEEDAPAASTTTDAAILILNWNGVDFLRELLPSLRAAVDRAAALGDHDVFVVDNGSDDGSVAFVEQEHPWARVIRHEHNLHFIRGNNAAMRSVPRDKNVLVLLNNDMVVEPDFLRALLEPFAEPRADDLFATTARIEMDGPAVETGRTRIYHKRGAFRQEQLPLAAGAATEPEPAHWAGGGSSAFCRRRFEALGGFDELYVPCYMEDVDLSYRARKRGWRIEFVPAAGVHHVHRGTSERVFGRRGVDVLDRRNRELFFWRQVTDLGWLLRHAFYMPWNAYKAVKHGQDLGTEYRALVRAIPRIPRAIVGRIGIRRTARRQDRDLVERSR